MDGYYQVFFFGEDAYFILINWLESCEMGFDTGDGTAADNGYADGGGHFDSVRDEVNDNNSINDREEEIIYIGVDSWGLGGERVYRCY